MTQRQRRRQERGVLLLVVVFIATAIAGLAAIVSSRVVSETRQQRTLENETRAFNAAYAQLHMALNVVNTSAYNEKNQNVELRESLLGLHGGTIAPEPGATEAVGEVLFYQGQNGESGRLVEPGGFTTGFDRVNAEAGTLATDTWLDNKNDPLYGFISGTNVRVYSGRDYIKRLMRLRGEPVTEVDPFGDSDAFFVLEAAGRAGGTVRLVAALVRENEPFSSFVFFQNRATLGVSGSPRGLLHSNESIAFYFPNGSYLDPVTAVTGFEFQAGATPQNTNLRDANPEANRIELEAVDFNELKGQADLFVGEPGLDADVKMYPSGKVRIKPHTPPRYDLVDKSYTYQKYVGKVQVTQTVQEQVQVGTTQVPYDEQVIDHYVDETYTEQVQVQTGTQQVAYQVDVFDHWDTTYVTKKVKVQTGTKKVTRTRQDPVYAVHIVTKYKDVKVWVPYNQGNAGGGTTVGGGAGGEAGEWVWEKQPYDVEEQYIDHFVDVEYQVDEPVYAWQDVQKEKKTKVFRSETRYRDEPVYEMQTVERTRQVPVYTTVTKYRDEPVYELQDVEKTVWQNQYEPVTVNYQEREYVPPVWQDAQYLQLGPEQSGTIYIDGRITRLYGDLLGRLTIVGNERVRVTGNIRYVDEKGSTAMQNGDNYALPYGRNPDYTGHSVLGVIARDDVIFSRYLPGQAEINGTLMSVNGRVGIDGFWADDTGELHKDSTSTRKEYLGEEGYWRERAYDRTGAWKTKRFVKDSLRRIGGVISNNRVMETFIKQTSDGLAKVDAGFKRGDMQFDINLLFNPPPNFVEVPRPVVTSYVPIVLVRNNE